MKISKFINFAVVALMLLAFTLTIAFYSSPPVSAEKAHTVNSDAVGSAVAVENYHTIRAKTPENSAFSDFRSYSGLIETGDIPISVANANLATERHQCRTVENSATNNRTQIKTLLEVATTLRTKPKPNDSASAKFTDVENARFSGFGGENNARAKV